MSRWNKDSGRKPAAGQGGRGNVRDDTEKRVDPTDGKAYTKEEFMDCYGGTKEWDSAEPVQSKVKVDPPASEERRQDPNDGRWYTKEMFLEYYGGTKEWDKAKRANDYVKEKGEGRDGPAASRPSRPPKKMEMLQEKTDEEITAMCQERQDARRARDFKTADRIRGQLMDMGVRLDDDSRTWTAGDRTGQWEAGGGMRREGGGGRGGYIGSKGREDDAGSAYTGPTASTTIQDIPRARKWGGEDFAPLSKAFPAPDNTEQLTMFFTGDEDADLKVHILLALPMEIFWGTLAHSSATRDWLTTTLRKYLDSGSPASVDKATKVISRLAMYKEKPDSRIQVRSFAGLLATKDGIFGIPSLAAMSRQAAHVPLLRESICSVLLACHGHYSENARGRGHGLFDEYLTEARMRMEDIVDANYLNVVDSNKGWPADAKLVALLRDILVDTLWPILKIAPFVVRALSPIDKWVQLLVLIYEVCVPRLRSKSAGAASIANEIAAAALDLGRIVFTSFPFPEVAKPNYDVTPKQVQIEQAMLQTLKHFGILTPVFVEQLPSSFDSLLKRTYGNECGEGFLMSELFNRMHGHVDELHINKGHLPAGVKAAEYLIDLVAVFNMEDTVLKDAVLLGRLRQDDKGGIMEIACGLLQHDAGGDSDFVLTPEVESVMQVVGDSASPEFVSKVLAYFDNDVEKAVMALIENNLPPHLAEEQKNPASSSAASGSLPPVPGPPPCSSSAPLPERKPARSTDPSRFVPFEKLRRKGGKEEEFDERLRNRIIQSVSIYEDEVDDANDYAPSGALEEEKRRRANASHAYQKLQQTGPSGNADEGKLIPVEESFDCPSDEEWGGDTDQESGDEMPRTLSGEATGAYRGKSGIRRATDEDKSRRSALEKNKGRYGNHNRKRLANKKTFKALA